MAQLAANQVNVYDSTPQKLDAQPMTASVEIFKGSAVGMNAGYARQLVAGDLFAGFAEQHVLEASGANGGAVVPVIRTGVIQAAITGAVVTDINKAVYMSDGATFTYSNAASAVLIGRVVRFESAGVVMVQFSVDAQAAS